MKKLLLMVATVMTVFTASAQRGGHGHFDGGRGGFHGGGYHGFYAPRVYLGVGGYAPFGYYGGYYGYPYYSYPFYSSRPSKLDMQVADIKHDYADRIASVKMDDQLTGRERREKIHELKVQRDDAVYDAKANYYRR